MRHLRDILKESLEEEVLKEHFKERYSTATQEEKQEILKLVSVSINQKTDLILKTFLEEIQQGSPELKRKKNIRIIFAILSFVASVGLALAVNQENWSFIIICGIFILIAQIYQIFSE